MLALILTGVSACSKYSFYDLAPAPNLYSQTGKNPYAALPAERCSSSTRSTAVVAAGAGVGARGSRGRR